MPTARPKLIKPEELGLVRPDCYLYTPLPASRCQLLLQEISGHLGALVNLALTALASVVTDEAVIKGFTTTEGSKEERDAARNVAILIALQHAAIELSKLVDPGLLVERIAATDLIRVFKICARGQLRRLDASGTEHEIVPVNEKLEALQEKAVEQAGAAAVVEGSIDDLYSGEAFADLWNLTIYMVRVNLGPLFGRRSPFAALGRTLRPAKS